MSKVNINGKQFSSYDLDRILFNVLVESGIQQGIVGIKLPLIMGVVQEQEFYVGLLHMGKSLSQNGLQFIILPPPLESAFSLDNKTQMESLGRRIQRDHDDGIRYNRLYIALYQPAMPDVIIPHHDLFIDLAPYHFEIMGTVTDNRE